MSSGFETTMHERLRRLTNTMNSIQTLSLWLIHHSKKHEEVILNTWLKEVKSNCETERLTSLMNLANDVIQNSRRKSPNFMMAFLPVLKPGIAHICEAGGDRAQNTVRRILDVWRDRSIYGAEQLRELRSGLKQSGDEAEEVALSSPLIDPASPSSTPSPSATPTKRDGGIESTSAEAPGDTGGVGRAAPTTSSSTSPPSEKRQRLDSKAFFRTSNELVDRLRKLEEPASADAQVRQLIASYPAQIANPALLMEIKSKEQAQELMDKISEASPIVSAYCARLKAEVEDRQAVQRLIGEYIEALNDVSERNKTLINSVKRRISRIDENKTELEKHIKSLPDLEEMFGEKSSAGQLPSLVELFK